MTGQRKTVPLSLPSDLDHYLRQEAKRTKQPIAQVIRRALGVGMPLQDDPASLARAVRDIYQRPTEYPISLKIALREACEAADESISAAIAQGHMLPGDEATIDGFVHQVGPYEIGPNQWVYGPISRKDRDDGFNHVVAGDVVNEPGRVVVQNRVFHLKPAPVELDGRLFWVYTNAKMDATATQIFQENLTRIWRGLKPEPEAVLA